MMVDQFPDTIWTWERIEEWFEYVKWYLKWNMPIFMICMAVLCVYMFVIVIVDIFAEARNRQMGKRIDDEDDDVDIEYF